ncbi:MAG: hypothetical protein ACRCX8_15735, partial [Sarcina sp.]
MFYGVYMDHVAKSPKASFLEGKQAQISSWFYNTTQCFQIDEQQKVGEDIYNPIDVIIDSVIEMGTGQKLSDDWKELSFEMIDHNTKKGIMYRFENETWITVNTSDIASPTKSVIVKRCNNILRWVDRETGNIIEYPCSIGYDVASPKPKYEKTIATPDNSLTLIVQGTNETRGLKVNQRFLFNGRPFKLTGINNVLQNGIVDTTTTLLYYDLYLDSILPTDDVNMNIANLYEYNYYVSILSSPKEQLKGYKGQIEAFAMYNGENVNRNIVYASNANATIDQNGNYELTGEVGSVATLKAYIEGNPSSGDSASINIVGSISKDIYTLEINPLIEELR